MPILSQPLLRDHALGEYVRYDKGLAELSVGRTTDARSTFQALTASAPAGYLWEAAALREAEADEALGDHSAALAIYERLSKAKTAAPDDVLIRMGMAAEAAGDLEKALCQVGDAVGSKKNSRSRRDGIGCSLPRIPWTSSTL